MKTTHLLAELLVVVVAIAALNFAAVWSVLGHSGLTDELLAVGAVPMTNLLGVSLLVGSARPGRHSFLLGFMWFGAMALALYVVLASCVPDETIGPYLRPVVKPLVPIVGTDRSVVFMPIAYYSVAIIVLSLPQTAFALLGGFLSKRYKVTIIRR
jgi:hypothetical protein